MIVLRSWLTPHQSFLRFFFNAIQEGFFTIVTNEFLNAGFETLQMVHGERMFNTTESQHLPPINVTFEHPFLSSMVKIQPSPDWFVGFSDFRTISYDTETYFNRVLIQSYVWDSGTDGGQTYTALDRDLDPQIPVYRFCARESGKSKRQCPDLTKGRIETPPLGQFLDYTGTYIPTPAEFECVLRVGEGDVFAGVPFNETQIRPPLSIPRPDDDFVDGVSPHDPEFEEKTGQANPRESSAWRCSVLVSSLQVFVAVGLMVTFGI
jgi:Spondin_N